MPTVNFNGRDYYVDLATVITEELNAAIWFRTNPLASSIDDLNIASLKISNATAGDLRDMVCRLKKPMDYAGATQTLLGCLSTVGAVACGAAAIGTDGAAAVLCETTWDYAIDEGAADCLKGVSGYIAEQLGHENVWIGVTTLAGLENPDATEIITNAVDLMCDDVKNNN